MIEVEEANEEVESRLLLLALTLIEDSMEKIRFFDVFFFLFFWCQLHKEDGALPRCAGILRHPLNRSQILPRMLFLSSPPSYRPTRIQTQRLKELFPYFDRGRA